MSSAKENKQIIPVLAAIIQNNGGNILIARRKPELSNGGKWEFPGGKLLFGESPEDCLKREIKEEMGIEIAVGSPYHLVNFRYEEKAVLLIGYRCEFLGGQWNLLDHDQVLWVEREKLKEYDFSAADIPIVHKLQSEVF
jgi:8-oxo-dGTP diphosphatase